MLNVEAFTAIEQALGVELPDFYKAFHQQEGVLIQELHQELNDADYICLSINADWIITHNRDMLKLPTTEGIARGKICIGTDGCGNDSLIALDNKDQRVFFIDHEEVSELLDEETNDFRWEDDRMEKYTSLRDYALYNIQLCRELREES